MRNFTAVFVLFVVLHFLTLLKPLYAFDSFVKYDNNPLSLIKLNGQREESVGHNTVYWENNEFVIRYWTLRNGKMTEVKGSSSDGIHWNENFAYNFEPIVNAHDATIVNFKGKRLLYYVAEVNGKYIIRKYNINDELNPTEKSDVILPGTSYDYEGNSCPHAYTDGDKVYLFHCSTNGLGWSMSLAVSSDGETFTKCTNNPLMYDSGSFYLYKENGVQYLFLHSSNGIEVMETTDHISCQTQWKNRHTILTYGTSYDSRHMVTPSVILKDNKLYLFYSGLDQNDHWNLSLALANPTLSKNKYILIPGFMGSWNKEAILHNAPSSYADWKLAPFVKEYDGLIGTFNALGYVKNQDYFVFPYDWRKKATESGNDLDSFINTKIGLTNSTTKITIIGHSLGGLVGRIYTQNHPSGVAKLITVGTPHKGVVQVYKPLEAGEIDKEDTMLWLAEKMIFILNKSQVESDRDTVQKMLPVLFDVFPTFNFLKKSDQFVDIQTMSIQNTTLTTFNSQLSSIYNLFYAIYGEKNTDTTDNGYIVEPPSSIDTLWGNYTDGKPTSSFKANGDYLVLSTSAKDENDPDFQQLPFDHGEIIYKKEGIKKILDTASIPYQDNQIVEGSKTVLTPSLIFLVKSPIELEAEFNGQVYMETDGIIFIPDALSGNYTLEAKGADKGTYTIYVGQVSEQNDIWDEYHGEITQDPPTSQTDTYTINFNRQFAISTIPTPTATATPTPTKTPTPSAPLRTSPTRTPTSTPKPQPKKNHGPIITTENLRQGSWLIPYVATIMAYDEDNDSLTMAFANLPPGIIKTLCLPTPNHLSCLLVGIPTKKGKFDVGIKIYDGVKYGSEELTIRIK
ncbi:MAG: alpha/beta fold hydrolase [bacterium]|nr:alpha/beta fold hydrolase [bacterium]